MDPRKDTDRAIAALAARQWGVATRRQLLDAGLSATAIARTSGRIGPGHSALREAIAERAALQGAATDSVLRLPATNVGIEGFRVDAAWRGERTPSSLTAGRTTARTGRSSATASTTPR